MATLQKCRHQAFPVTPEVDAAYQSGALPAHGTASLALALAPGAFQPRGTCVQLRPA